MKKPIVPPPVQAAVFAALSWFAASRAPMLAIDSAILKTAGLVIGGAGFLIDLTAVVAFFRARTTISPLNPVGASTLVVKGLYRISRNPMYLGMLLILIGWASYLSNLAAYAPIPIFVWLITVLQIKPEEEALRAKFGADYEDYCARVRRWI